MWMLPASEECPQFRTEKMIFGSIVHWVPLTNQLCHLVFKITTSFPSRWRTAIGGKLRHFLFRPNCPNDDVSANWGCRQIFPYMGRRFPMMCILGRAFRG